jgi:multidrug efflux pump subunit AcrA (membrane-fusion protein)
MPDEVIRQSVEVFAMQRGIPCGLSQYRVAESQASEAETMLGYTKLTAPFTGVITRKLADVGDLASLGRALLEIEDPRTLLLKADVPDGLLDKIHRGDKLLVHIASVSNLFEGEVSEIVPIADPNSRTFFVKLDLPAMPGPRRHPYMVQKLILR